MRLTRRDHTQVHAQIYRKAKNSTMRPKLKSSIAVSPHSLYGGWVSNRAITVRNWRNSPTPLETTLDRLKQAIESQANSFSLFRDLWSRVGGSSVRGSGSQAVESTRRQVPQSGKPGGAIDASDRSDDLLQENDPNDATSAPNRTQPGTGDAGPAVLISTHKSVLEFERDEWNACATSEGAVNPFLLHQFFSALEESGSACASRGWAPCHVALRSSVGSGNETHEEPSDTNDSASQGKLLAIIPAYLKSHSYGEYVFDHSWANLSAQLGDNYYPKLQCAVPFSPVPGLRILVSPTEDAEALRRVVFTALPQVAEALQVSSVHMTFNVENEWKLASRTGLWLSRMGVQFHWKNDGYATFDDFLAALKQSKRKSIRQERKAIVKQGLRVVRLTGDDITEEIWDSVYEFYLNTTDRKWGTAYLTRSFFDNLQSSMSDRVLLVVAYDEEYSSDAPVAAALNLIGDTALYGRHWGCKFGEKYKCLHFELCYYQAIEAAIELGLGTVEAGAQGMHKISRGYLPTATYSNHFIRNPKTAFILRRYLKSESAQMDAEIEYLTQQASPYKDLSSGLGLAAANAADDLKRAQDEAAKASGY